MTLGIKDMIARCIARLRQGDCASCENRENCVLHKAGAFGPTAASENRLPELFARIVKSVVARAGSSGPVAREVERRIPTLLERGEVGIDRVARDMGMSRQTLYRRLKDEGVTFDQLLDRLRRRLALRYLKKEGLSVKAASYRLGFSDPAAFSRAFKRWTGSSPRGAASGVGR